MYILIAILIFGILVAIHEFGHFITAKLCGVRVLEFSIGMGPQLLKKQGKETMYSLRLLPIGGFCAMEEDEASDDPRAFPNQSLPKKFLILVAGAGMNFLLGFLLILFVLSGSQSQTTEITGFMEGCPYQEAGGLQVGDVIVSVDGHRTYVKDDMTMFLDRGNVHDITVERGGQLVTLENYPMTRVAYEGTGQMMYGLNLRLTSGVAEQLKYAWHQSVSFVRMVWVSLGDLISGRYGVNDLSGVVGIVDVMNDVGKQSINIRAAVLNLTYVTALITVNLAVMNLLPIPALDGGRIFLMLLFWPIEKIFKRRPDPKYEGYIHTAGLVLLMGLMVYVAFNDVMRIVR